MSPNNFNPLVAKELPPIDATDDFVLHVQIDQCICGATTRRSDLYALRMGAPGAPKTRVLRPASVRPLYTPSVVQLPVRHVAACEHCAHTLPPRPESAQAPTAPNVRAAWRTSETQPKAPNAKVNFNLDMLDDL